VTFPIRAFSRSLQNRIKISCLVHRFLP
jgi:hypothetical protein